jgi:hypothetical protein
MPIFIRFFTQTFDSSKKNRNFKTRKRGLRCDTSIQRPHRRFGDGRVEAIAKSASLALRAKEIASSLDLIFGTWSHATPAHESL